MMIPRQLTVIETENLQLRSMTNKDAADIFQIRSDPAMHEYTDSKPDTTMDDTIAYIARMNQGVDEGRWVIWAIMLKHTRKVIGSICIWNLNKDENSAELGYGIAPAYQGQGLMREALLCVLKYALCEMKIGVLRAYTEEANAASKKLLERCGFAETGRIDEQGQHQDRIYHMSIYEIKLTRISA